MGIQFGEVFDSDHFISSLEPQVRVIRKLPPSFQSLDVNIMGVNVSLYVSSGGVDLSSGGVDVSSGGVDLSSGGVDLSSGGVDVSSGGVDLSSGGVDLSSGGVDVSSGGVDLSSGGIDLSSGGVDVSLGGVDLSLGRVDLFLRLVPLMRRVGLIHFHGFLNALASDPMPAHVQRLRCRCMFHALTFLPAVHATAQLAIQRLRSAAGALLRVQDNWMDGEDEAGKQGAGNEDNQGKIKERERVEGQVESQVKIQVKNQVNGTSGEYQGQERDEADKEAEEEAEQLRDIRRLLFPVLHAYEQQGRLNAPDWYRRIGRCPVAPEEAALVLAGMGVGRFRPVFLVGVSAEPCRLVLGGEGVEQERRIRAQQEEQLRGQGRRWFNGCRRLEAVRALFPSLWSIDTLLSPQEIAPYSHSPLLITALETIVAGESDLFLAADGSSQLAALVAGRRMYFGSRSDKISDCGTSGCTSASESGYQHGYRPSVRINRAQLAEDLGGGKDLRAGEEWVGDAEERIMEHPRDEACMCFGKGDKGREELESGVESGEWGGAGEEARGGQSLVEGREVRGGGFGREESSGSESGTLRADSALGAGNGNEMGDDRLREKGGVRVKGRVVKGGGGSNGLAKRQGLRGVVGGRGVSAGVDDDVDEGEEGDEGAAMASLSTAGVGIGQSTSSFVAGSKSLSCGRKQPAASVAFAGKQRHVAPIRAASSGSGGNGDSNKEKPAMQSLYDLGSNLLTRVLSGGDMSGMPTASGEVSDLVGRPLFFALHNWFLELGGVYRLAFGPKAFVVISDPIVARHVLKENAFAYDKGMLAELLEPIMGKGLIPADLETWKQRRRAIVPGFHAAYLEAMALVFSECSKRSVDKLQALCDEAGATAGSEGVRMDMESEYSSIALDIIGISVFNYDFGSVTRESPVIKAVYGTLSEAEHRATFYIPYWNIPFISLVVPRQMKFQQDLKVINDCLDDLITRARATRQEDDLEALQQRDYSKVRDASLLRFLVDLRGEDCDDKQLRDDLMTMLVAGHETTAAVLTWATYMLAQHPRVLAKLQEEVDRVLGDRLATLQDIKSLEYTRLVVSEALRLYPQPPLLIRRALANDHLPSGYKGNPEGYNLPKGTDLFVSVFNINRSPHYWENPEEFRPERFLERRSGDGIPGWDGYDPDRLAGALYPNEVASDFAFLPFGGGPRKCVGDQFALMESTVALAMILRHFNVRLDGPPEDTEMVMGATMHTKSGLWCRLTPRENKGAAAADAAAAATANA
ncbi:unnamed protein product [Closterium sp. Yama58-4]|nr:unnamed protein product [Closterium sp. Yama58-4]